jgi:hypothetical protein
VVDDVIGCASGFVVSGLGAPLAVLGAFSRACVDDRARVENGFAEMFGDFGSSVMERFLVLDINEAIDLFFSQSLTIQHFIFQFFNCAHKHIVFIG